MRSEIRSELECRCQCHADDYKWCKKTATLTMKSCHIGSSHSSDGASPHGIAVPAGQQQQERMNSQFLFIYLLIFPPPKSHQSVG